MVEFNGSDLHRFSLLQIVVELRTLVHRIYPAVVESREDG